MPGMKFMKCVFALAFRFRPQTPEDRFDIGSRLGSPLLDLGLVFEQLIPDVPGSRQQNTSVVVVEDRDYPCVPERLRVERDPPQRPVANHFRWQVPKAYT